MKYEVWLIDNTFAFKHVYKVRVLRMVHLITFKSNLMSILEKLNDNRNNRRVAGPNEDQMKVAIVDRMAEVQLLDKPEWIRNCAQLAEHSNRVMQTHTGSNEVRLIFDRYDLPFSLKAATRVRRQGSQAPVYYHITDTTHIAKVPMKRLLSHT